MTIIDANDKAILNAFLEEKRPLPAQTFDILSKLIEEMEGPPGWYFDYRQDGLLFYFMIHVTARDNYDPSKERTTSHEHPVPFATYNAKTWRRWLFDRCRASMDHEMGEMIRWGELRPFAPTHGPGEDPYTVREYRDPIDALTTQNGRVRVGHGSQQTLTRAELLPGDVNDLRQKMWKG